MVRTGGGGGAWRIIWARCCCVWGWKVGWDGGSGRWGGGLRGGRGGGGMSGGGCEGEFEGTGDRGKGKKGKGGRGSMVGGVDRVWEGGGGCLACDTHLRLVYCLHDQME